MSRPGVHRYCFVRLRDELIATREALASALLDELRTLCAPHEVWLGVPGDDSAARWDLAIVIAFPELAAWQALAASSAFGDFMARLDADAAVVKAWTFAAPRGGAG